MRQHHECICGKSKARRHSACKACWEKLSHNMRARLLKTAVELKHASEGSLRRYVTL